MHFHKQALLKNTLKHIPHKSQINANGATSLQSQNQTLLDTHSGVKTHTCSECEKSFNQAGNLTTHMLTHTGEKVHKCAECGNSFDRPGNLKQHMLIHSGEKPHKCPQCGYASSHTGALRVHIKTHSLQKPNQCKFCDFSAVTKSHLTRLYSSTVGRRHITVMNAEVKNQAGTLKDHRCVHTGEKPYKCTQCCYSSARSFSLKQHMIRHSTTVY